MNGKKEFKEREMKVLKGSMEGNMLYLGKYGWRENKTREISM